MSMSVRNNIAAINTNRNLTLSQNTLNGSIAKLSSGYRINSGKDGPADLVISEQLRAQISGLNRAVRNTNEATNVMSIAEGALNEMNSILKNMKALAIHAASNGVTSPEQIEADQAEMDSYIQTLQRIADTTKYSDQFLLNGSKDITYSVSTEIKGTQNNQLVDTGATTFEQIYKRDGYSVTIGFTGATNADKETNIGDANMKKQASKAYLEIDTAEGTLSQVDEDGMLTQSQSFILTGSLGSRQFTFGAGTSVSQIVTAIESYSGSTGINATLTFNSAQTINQTVTACAATVSIGTNGVTDARGACTMTVFDNYYTDANGDLAEIVTGMTGCVAGVQYGLNTDGQGQLYIKVTGADTFEIYKDASLSAASLVASGSSGNEIIERNNSGLSGLTLTLDADAKYGSVAILSTGNVLLSDDNGATGGICKGANATGAVISGTFDMANSVASGVQLGINTDAGGKIYFKVVTDENNLSTVYAYNDESMSSQYLVAMSQEDITLTADGGVILNAIWNDEHTASTGLSLHLNINGSFEEGTHTGEYQFTNLGARISTTEYGSDEFIQIQQLEGGLFTYYDQQNKASSATLVDAGGTGVTYRQYGQDATINVNGQQMKTNGLTLDMATTDLMAKIVFNAGSTGSTTIAQVGYTEGSIFTKNTSLTFDKADLDGTTYTGANQYFSALLNNACHNTNETIGKFTGGMQLQLGESSGDQDRTVVAVKSMAVSNLGRISVTQQFDKSKAVVETKTLSLEDVQGGQIANLSDDPVLAMKIIDQAINDVSGLRAQIGAVQANMLQTNANNLEVAIENITNTESGIRDTDMASEMTSYTSAQVLQNAGISMLAQANSQTQSVLSLLQ